MHTNTNGFLKQTKRHQPQRDNEQQAKYEKRRPWKRTNDKREQMQ